MKSLLASILCLTLGLVSSLSVVEETWQEPLSTSSDQAGFIVNSNSSDESEIPDGTPISLSRVKVFGKSASVLKARWCRLRSVGTSPLKTQTLFISHQGLFRREGVLRI
jgi:hypothetical protein